MQLNSLNDLFFSNKSLSSTQPSFSGSSLRPIVSHLSPENPKEQHNLNLEPSQEGLWDWNLQTNQVYYSTEWKAMLGFEENEIGDSPIEWLHRVHPEDVEKLRTALTAHFREKTPHLQNEHRLLHADGLYRWVKSQGRAVRSPQGEVYHMVGFQSHLAQSKQILEAQQEKVSQFQAIAEALASPAFVTTAKDYTILYVNKNYAKSGDCFPLGIAPEALLGRKVTDLCHNISELHSLKEAIAKKDSVNHHELQIQRVDGGLIWIDLFIQPIVSDGQSLLLLYFFDITEHKQAETENNWKVQQQLENSNYIKQSLQKDNNKLDPNSRPTLSKVFTFIENNYRNGISLREVAEAISYSPAYLTNLMQRQTGKTVNQWITEYRMLEARLLLLKTNKNINLIAVSIGYQSTEHFIRQFRQHHNTTPKAWRDKNRQKVK